MKFFFATILGLSLMLASAMTAAETRDDETLLAQAKIMQAQWMSRLSPTIINWLQQQSRDIRATPGHHLDQAVLRTATNERLAGQHFTDLDVDVLVALVRMQLADDADAMTTDIVQATQDIAARKRAAGYGNAGLIQQGDRPATGSPQLDSTTSKPQEDRATQEALAQAALQIGTHLILENISIDHHRKAVEAIQDVQKKLSVPGQAIDWNLR